MGLKNIIRCFLCISVVLSSCSTTKNLPEGQVLYTGQKGIAVENRAKTPAGELAMEEVEAALAKAPNNAFFSSSSMRTPLPIGLWYYNRFVNSEKGFGKWMFKRYAATPVFISSVNPEIRTKAATNILRDYGFFNGTVGYEIIGNKKNEKKAKIQYFVDMKNPYFLDSVEYRRFSPEMMELVNRSQMRSRIQKGDQFSVIELDAERERLSTLFRNVGYYYFRPEFIGYRADTTRVSGQVDLQVFPKTGVPEAAVKRWDIGNIFVQLYGAKGEVPNDSLVYEDMTIYYHDKLKIRPNVLHKQFRFHSGQRYSQRRVTTTQQKLAELGVFRYTEMKFLPQDTTSVNNLLNVTVNSNFDLPYDSELELNIATKSNDYAGPGVSYSVTKRNVFRGGESFSVGIKGSYEWQTKTPKGGSSAKINSWEVGINSALTFPRLVFPRLGKNTYDFPATTTFGLNIDQLNRAHFFKMLSFGGEASYSFQPTKVSRHTVTPLKLTFSTLQNKTGEFKDILDENKALAQSMESQFIPALSYTYTYDNAAVRGKRNLFWWQSSFTSSGNLTSAAWALTGKGYNEEKKLFGATMAHFFKTTSEARYTWRIDRNTSLATRVMGGLIYPYASNKVAPYKEQFFIGGANSIRAFTVRSIGPGKYVPKKNDKYGYLDQTGDIKFEANVEYRFRIVNDLHGAIFLDAGNVWLLRDKGQIEGGKFKMNSIGENLALGTGAGLRYDLSFLVIRLDCGVALHLPYETEKSGYYNIPKFSDGLGIHFAIGLPF